MKTISEVHLGCGSEIKQWYLKFGADREKKYNKTFHKLLADLEQHMEGGNAQWCWFKAVTSQQEGSRNNSQLGLLLWSLQDSLRLLWLPPTCWVN